MKFWDGMTDKTEIKKTDFLMFSDDDTDEPQRGSVEQLFDLKNGLDETIPGEKTFSVSPKVPEPVDDDDAVNKKYVDNHSGVNYIPENYVSVGKYLKFFGDNYNLRNIFSLQNSYINGITCESIKFQSVIGAGNFRYLFEALDVELLKFRGEAKYSFYIKSDDSCVLSSYLFKNSSSCSGQSNISLIAGEWKKIEYTITIDDNAEYLFNRIGCDVVTGLSYAMPRISSAQDTNLAEVVKFNQNEELELDKLLFNSGLNLYGGIEFDNVYMNYSDLSHNANDNYGISKKILVEQLEKYTFNHHHSVIAFDKNDRYVYSWTMDDFASSIMIPLGVHYIRCNVNKGWDSFIINKGDTATEADFYKDLKNDIRGILIKNKSITQNKLSDELIDYLIDGSNFKNASIPASKLTAELLSLIQNPILQNGSLELSKLSSALLAYLANGANIINSTITQNKLANELLTYMANAANLTNESLTLNKLSAEVIQFIQSAGGGTINNNADGVSINVNGSNQLYFNPDSINVVYSKIGETTQDIFARIAEISGKVTLCLLNDVIIHNSYTTAPSNLYKVVGLGGKLVPYGTVSTYRYLTFQQETIFECGNYQMFDKWVIATCQNGFLQGQALSKWWGIAADGITNEQIAVDAFTGSNFKELRFTSGIYVSYPSNGISGRTFIMDEGAIIDGVFHVAYGSNIGASTKVWCKNTTFIGQLVSTVRVGGAQIDGLTMMDGIKILAVNSNYINQTIEGTCKGIHWHFGCKNLNIGDCIVEEINPLYNDGNLIMSYGLGIDGYAGEEYPHDIYIKSLKCGINSSSFYDIILSNVNNIIIDNVSCTGGSTQIRSIEMSNSNNIKIGEYSCLCDKSDAFHVYASLCKKIIFEHINIKSTTLQNNYGLFLDAGCEDITVNNLVCENQQQGIRLVNCNYIVIVKYIPKNCTTPIAQSGANYFILKQF